MAPSLAYCIALGKVVVVAGPTASGKSAHALKLAKERDGVILNADSLQVYRGLEILTAQPQADAIHRLYGFLDLTETCSAGKWLDLVLPEIRRVLDEGKLPIVVGGTGLYLKVLMEGMPTMPPSNLDIRQQLENQDQEDLYIQLLYKDPNLASHINPNDRQRTLRGLEVFYSSGKPLSAWQTETPMCTPFEFEKILLMPSPAELEVHIATRIDQMLEQGVLDEVRAALAAGPSPTAMKAIGLREFGAYLAGECTLEQAKELTLIHTRQYAKRQRTWFRHQF